jgi:hypothetical protein
VLTSVANGLAHSLESSKIALPSDYRWSYLNATQCSRKVSAPDCFTLPLTYCEGSENALALANVNVNAAKEFLSTPADICTQAKRAKKPLIWVIGQYLLYQLKLSQTLERQLEKEVNQIFDILTAAVNENKRDDKRCLIAALHVRTANPDEGRKKVDGARHLEWLRVMNEEISHVYPHHRICGAYVSSDGPNATIFANFTPGVPQQLDEFTFLLMPRFVSDGKIEMEFLLRCTTFTVTTTPCNCIWSIESTWKSWSGPMSTWDLLRISYQ